MFQGLRRFFAFAEEMIEISTENVKRIVVWLKPELLSRMDGWLETANCKNRSEFISKALRFYMGYLTTDAARTAILPPGTFALLAAIADT